jgi:DNA-binding transcriptional LysR family regulator
VLPGGWHRIELRHLATLQAIAEEGSFVRAAERLGYAQSAVSQQLAALEGIVGACLVRRSRGARGAVPTEEGARFLERSRVVLGEMKAAAGDVRGHSAVRLAVERSVGAARIIPALGAGGGAFEVAEGVERARLLSLVETGEHDAALVTGEPPATCESVVLYLDHWVVAAPRGAVATPLAPAELTALRHVSLAGVTAVFPLARLLPPPAATAETPATLAAMVHAGMGVAVVPDSLLHPWRSQLELRPIDADGLERSVSLVWRGRRPVKPALRALVDQLALILGSRNP